MGGRARARSGPAGEILASQRTRETPGAPSASSQHNGRKGTGGSVNAVSQQHRLTSNWIVPPDGVVATPAAPASMHHPTNLEMPSPLPLLREPPLNATQPSSSPANVHAAGALVIAVPLTVWTVSAFAVLLALAGLGVVYVRKILKQHKCSCPLCKGEYVIDEKIGEGGFGSVYVVRTRQDKESAIQGIRARASAFMKWLQGPAAAATDDDLLTRANLTHARAPAPVATEEGTKEEAPRPGRPRMRTRGSSSSMTSSGDSIDEEDPGAKTPGPLVPATPVAAAPLTHVLKMVPVTDINDATEAQREARDLRYLRHPRIVRYIDDFMHSTPAGATKEGSLYVCIVMERCNDDLRRYIQQWRRKKAVIPESTIVRWAAQLVSALKYCHARNVCHRDVKSQNIFLATPHHGSPASATDLNATFDDVKLGDFGLARWFDKPFTAYTEAGTDVYKSPEAFMGGKRDGRKADIWALGLVLVELATKQFTWERSGSLGAQVLHKEAGALEKVLALVPQSYSTSLRLLIKKCLTPNADDRPTAEELFRFKILRRAIAAKSTTSFIIEPHARVLSATAFTKSSAALVSSHTHHSRSLTGPSAAVSAPPLAVPPAPLPPAPAAVHSADASHLLTTPVIPLAGGPAARPSTPPTKTAAATAAHLMTPATIHTNPSDRELPTDIDLGSDAPPPRARLVAAISDGDADAESDSRSTEWQRVEHRKHARRRRKHQPAGYASST